MSKAKFQRQVDRVAFLRQIGWSVMLQTSDEIYLALGMRVCTVSKTGRITELLSWQASNFWERLTITLDPHPGARRHATAPTPSAPLSRPVSTCKPTPKPRPPPVQE